MKLDRFSQEFSSVEVLQVRLNHHFCRLGLRAEGSSASIIILDFKDESLGSVAISNPSQPGHLKVSLYKQNKENLLKLVGQTKENNKDRLFFDCCFGAGRYFVFVESQFAGCSINYLGEGNPEMQFKEEVSVEGFRNQQTEYLPVAPHEVAESRISDPYRTIHSGFSGRSRLPDQSRPQRSEADLALIR